MNTAPDSPRILIVDDNPEIAALITFMLSQEGFEVHSVLNGLAAVTLHENFRSAGTPFPRLILDWFMPDMGGLDVARLIRQSDDAVKIAVLTPYYEEIAQERVKEVKAELRVNTIDMQSLSIKVCRVLSRVPEHALDKQQPAP